MNYLVIAESHRDYVVATSFSTAYGDKFATASRDGTVRYASCDFSFDVVLKVPYLTECGMSLNIL